MPAGAQPEGCVRDFPSNKSQEEERIIHAVTRFFVSSIDAPSTHALVFGCFYIQARSPLLSLCDPAPTNTHTQCLSSGARSLISQPRTFTRRSSILVPLLHTHDARLLFLGVLCCGLDADSR